MEEINHCIDNELIEIYGEMPDILKFDETMYETDLSYITSSI